MMTISIILLYLFGLTVVISNAKREGALKVSDLVMFLVAPCLLLPVLMLRLASFFVNVDTVIKFYDQNNAQ
jgi:hypothetical protein